MHKPVNLNPLSSQNLKVIENLTMEMTRITCHDLSGYSDQTGFTKKIVNF